MSQTAPLLDNQRKAFDKLSQFKVGALFMDAGTGKTRAAYELYRSVPDCDYVLWLTPFQTKSNLRAELDKWGAKSIHIEGIESLSNSDRLYLELLNRLSRARKPFIIVDESLKIKNWEAKRTQRIIELGKKAEFKLILNGTPLSRNILDLWAQMEFLSPRILNMGTAEYKNTFCEWTKVTRQINGRAVTREWVDRYHNVDYLYSIIGPYVYECDLQLDIREQNIEVPYDVDADTSSAYHELKCKYLDDKEMAWRNNNIFLEMTQKMQHLYCCTEDKFAKLSAILSANPIEKVIVFAKYIDSQQTIKEKYPKLTVLSYGKHTYGLNLQDYNVTVYWEKTWDYAQLIQTKRRTFRTGQLMDCVYYHMTANVGLDKLIAKNISKKVSLLDYFKQVSIQQLNQDL